MLPEVIGETGEPMTVIDLLHERAAREAPRYLETFEHQESLTAEFVFSGESLSHAVALELRREIRRRGLAYSVTRRGRCVFLTNHALWGDVEDELALLLDGLLKRTRSVGET